MQVGVAFVLAGLAAVLIAHLLARSTGLPSAVLLVAAGGIYALLPGPNLTLDPQVILVVVLPPLLFAAALNSSLVALRGDAATIGGLSVGLVLVTAVAVGLVLHAAVPAVPLAVAIALGAAIAPPDPVAALSVGRRSGLPARLITLVEGEGLLNDAVALTMLKVAVAAAVGEGFSLGGALLKFLLTAAGGAAVGLAVALALAQGRRLLADSLLENALSLATPFAAYLAAEELHVSGVLSVVIAGLWLGHRGPTMSSDSRLQTRPVWRLVEFLLEGFVFLLIGQQLPTVVRGLDAYPTHTVVAAAAVSVLLVLVLRPAWLLLTVALPYWLRARAGRRPSRQPLTVRDLIALSWAGTRGVITLAAAFSLPLTLGGRDFPSRDLLLFCAYLVVVVTLVGQGLTFGPLVRRLRFPNAELENALLRNQARLAAIEASLARLDELVEAGEQPAETVAVLRRVTEIRRKRYADRVALLSAVEDDVLPQDGRREASVRLRRAMIDAERESLLEWRDSGRLPDASLRVLQRELDHEESLLPR
ncbi:MAG: monovalent cation/hydrogen antiporter [Frankiales bacterium]|nr:monovalent cation/hydrogen antiporter [Frankiales bacterium]